MAKRMTLIMPSTLDAVVIVEFGVYTAFTNNEGRPSHFWKVLITGGCLCCAGSCLCGRITLVLYVPWFGSVPHEIDLECALIDSQISGGVWPVSVTRERPGGKMQSWPFPACQIVVCSGFFPPPKAKVPLQWTFSKPVTSPSSSS